MMRKKLALFLMCSLLAGAVQAGPGPRRFSRQKFVRKKQAVTHTLERRARSSYNQALHKQKPPYGFWEDTPALILNVPLDRTPLHARELYPDIPFLITPEQTELYLKSRINREIVRAAASGNQWVNQVRARLKDFKRAQVKITHSPKEDLPWLARQISNDTLYLLLGEVHEETSVSTAVHTLIRLIREQQPERKIFLFTEFMVHPTNEVINNNFYKKMFAALKADETLANIPIIGLEQELAVASENILVCSQYKPMGQDFCTTTEGMRLRNNYWLNVLQKYRAENPDALFIVYAGTAHIGYTYPRSLGGALQGPQTLAVSLHPDDQATPFDTLTKNIFINERILQFNNTELARLSGFDVHIKVSIFSRKR